MSKEVIDAASIVHPFNNNWNVRSATTRLIGSLTFSGRAFTTWFTTFCCVCTASFVPWVASLTSWLCSIPSVKLGLTLVSVPRVVSSPPSCGTEARELRLEGARVIPDAGGSYSAFGATTSLFFDNGEPLAFPFALVSGFWIQKVANVLSSPSDLNGLSARTSSLLSITTRQVLFFSLSFRLGASIVHPFNNNWN